MFNKFNFFKLNDNQMFLHEKKVEIAKLTPEKWKQLFETIDQLPGLIIQVMLAPKEDFYSFAITACQIALDEVVEVVSVLTELDSTYIHQNVGVNELIEYLVRTVKRNELVDVAKNLKSLLPSKER